MARNLCNVLADTRPREKGPPEGCCFTRQTTSLIFLLVKLDYLNNIDNELKIWQATCVEHVDVGEKGALLGKTTITIVLMNYNIYFPACKARIFIS